MVKGDELAKYVIERVVRYMETPKEVRKQARAGRKELKEHWEVRWFGMLPLALRMWSGRWGRRKEKER
ncbi:YqzE family protein [Paenibacillus validus]|uniref:YqzE family protein n=1 Tax=Paenibacillus validus TaxID=44253 RepID=A0A7X2ZED8_9BACL|nr:MULTISPECIES: YqzE family protein [Paenibacillus]MED4601759.1 YqzE family protein [Paenibacillus validus]MED4605472.1 YqzE family protein [Paenibacillus validus]MUG73337.1 YqzE family protein [Paenibacillus validus]